MERPPKLCIAIQYCDLELFCLERCFHDQVTNSCTLWTSLHSINVKCTCPLKSLLRAVGSNVMGGSEGNHINCWSLHA